jgi:hypothetical protein
MVSTSEEEYDDITAVIQHPALLIELTTNPIPELYYYRYIGSDNTILIAARKEEDHWEAFKCVKNPQSGFLSDLLKRGRQII